MNDITPLNPEPTYSRREDHLSYVKLSRENERLQQRIAALLVERANDRFDWQRERRELLLENAELRQMVIDAKSNV